MKTKQRLKENHNTNKKEQKEKIIKKSGCRLVTLIELDTALAKIFASFMVRSASPKLTDHSVLYFLNLNLLQKTNTEINIFSLPRSLNSTPSLDSTSLSLSFSSSSKSASMSFLNMACPRKKVVGEVGT